MERGECFGLGPDLGNAGFPGTGMNNYQRQLVGRILRTVQQPPITIDFADCDPSSSSGISGAAEFDTVIIDEDHHFPSVVNNIPLHEAIERGLLPDSRMTVTATPLAEAYAGQMAGRALRTPATTPDGYASLDELRAEFSIPASVVRNVLEESPFAGSMRLKDGAIPGEAFPQVMDYLTEKLVLSADKGAQN